MKSTFFVLCLLVGASMVLAPTVSAHNHTCSGVVDADCGQWDDCYHYENGKCWGGHRNCWLYTETDRGYCMGSPL